MTLKFGKFIPLAIIFLGIACGAITLELDTKVADETDIRHDMRLEASGQIASLVSEDFNEDDLPENCTGEVDLESIVVNCTNLSPSELARNELAVEDEGVEVYVTNTDSGDHWEYRTTTMNVLFSAADELTDNPLTQGMELDAIIKARFNWTVEVPGEIVETNAEATEGNVASFNADPTDTREEFFVVSREKKSTGLFGSCN